MSGAVPTFAIAGIHAESNPRNATATRRAAFRELQGDGVLEHPDFHGLASDAWRLAGAYHARAASGGHVGRSTLTSLTDTLLDALQRLSRVDGVLLCTHGAMRADGFDDADGEWIASVRAALGTHVPIVGVFDTHGTPTQRSRAALDGVVTFRTVPHVDQVATLRRGLALLARAARSPSELRVAWCGVPLRLPSERAPSDRGPLSDAIARLAHLPSGVVSADVFIGNAWAPPGAPTVGTVAIGTDRTHLDAFAASTTNALWEARDAFAYPMETGDLAATAVRLRRAGTERIVIADSGDVPGAGARGDRVEVLETLLQNGARRALLVGLVAPAWHAACVDRRVGERIELPGPDGADGWRATLLAPPRHVAPIGRALAVAIDHVTVVAVAQRNDPPPPEALRALGIDHAAYPVVALKSGFVPNAYAPAGTTPWLALSPGVADHRSIPGSAAPAQPSPDRAPNV